MQKVYCVFAIDSPEEEWLQGVFSTEDLATEAVKSLPPRVPHTGEGWPDYSVVEFPLDSIRD